MSAILLSTLLRAHGQTSIPFVGCPSDGMSGPEAAPANSTYRVGFDSAVAVKLAYYSVTADGGGVLAPRGWQCRNVYGSDGSFLVVAPRLPGTENIVKALQTNGFTGPVVVRNFVLGFTSGRDEVASVILRLFPAHIRFARDAAAMFDQPRPKYLGPYRSDHLHYLSHSAVEFETPAGRLGTGTVQGHFRPDGNAVPGAHLLVRDNGDCCDLNSVAIRLPAAERATAIAIRSEMERESAPVIWKRVPAQ